MISDFWFIKCSITVTRSSSTFFCSFVTYILYTCVAVLGEQVEKKAGASPLSQFLLNLQRQAVQHQTALRTPSVLVGSDKKQRQASDNEESEDEEDDAEQGAKVFSNQWLPTKKVPVYVNLSMPPLLKIWAVCASR
jgi:hypothetical protein